MTIIIIFLNDFFQLFLYNYYVLINTTIEKIINNGYKKKTIFKEYQAPRSKQVWALVLLTINLLLKKGLCTLVVQCTIKLYVNSVVVQYACKFIQYWCYYYSHGTKK